jgi:hypothetical protein
MNISDCIKSLDLSNGLTTEELQRYACLNVANRNMGEGLSDDLREEVGDIILIDNHELAVILFKAFQELKGEIDLLKERIQTLENN